MSGANLSAIIGSSKTAKVDGCRRALALFAKSQACDVLGIDAPSGVAGVPVGDAECLRGAANRAEHCRRTYPDAQYWIGVESGLRPMPGAVYAMTTYAFVWAADGRLGLGSSSSHPVVQASGSASSGLGGAELLARFPSGNQSIAQLTDGAYTLEHKTYEAVLCALATLGLCADPRQDG